MLPVKEVFHARKWKFSWSQNNFMMGIKNATHQTKQERRQVFFAPDEEYVYFEEIKERKNNTPYKSKKGNSHIVQFAFLLLSHATSIILSLLSFRS